MGIGIIPFPLIKTTLRSKFPTLTKGNLPRIRSEFSALNELR